MVEHRPLGADTFRIAAKRAMLDHETLAPNGALSFLL